MGRERSDDEASLAERARAGDQASFAALVERLSPSLMSFFAIRGLDPVMAEEGVQETFFRAYNALEGYDSRFAFRSWLYGIAANVFLQNARERKRHGHKDMLESDAVERDPDPSRELLEDERRSAIRSALEALPDRMQLVLQLRFFENKSCEEIAGILGTTLGAVSPLIYRAKAALRGRLEGVIDPKKRTIR